MSKAVQINAKAITEVFDKVVSGIKSAKHNNAVDVKLDFKSINIDSKGILVWSKKKEKQMEISLATTVTPDS